MAEEPRPKKKSRWDTTPSGVPAGPAVAQPPQPPAPPLDGLTLAAIDHVCNCVCSGLAVSAQAAQDVEVQLVAQTEGRPAYAWLRQHESEAYRRYRQRLEMQCKAIEIKRNIEAAARLLSHRALPTPCTPSLGAHC